MFGLQNYDVPIDGRVFRQWNQYQSSNVARPSEFVAKHYVVVNVWRSGHPSSLTDNTLITASAHQVLTENSLGTISSPCSILCI